MISMVTCVVFLQSCGEEGCAWPNMSQVSFQVQNIFMKGLVPHACLPSLPHCARPNCSIHCSTSSACPLFLPFFFFNHWIEYRFVQYPHPVHLLRVDELVRGQGRRAGRVQAEASWVFCGKANLIVYLSIYLSFLTPIIFNLNNVYWL